MANVPKGHHTVAQMLLSRFAEKGQVRLVSRTNLADAHPSSVGDALKVRHFYTLDLQDGSRSTELESRGLSRLEGDAASAIRRIVDEGRFPPSRESRDAVSLFLAYQLVRGEGMRAALLEWHATLARRTLELELEVARQATMSSGRSRNEHVRGLLESLRAQLIEQHQREPTPAEVRAELRKMRLMTRKGRWTVNSPANFHIQTAFPSANEVAGIIASRRWQLLTFEEPALLTGDEPVAMVSDNPDTLGVPLGTANAAAMVFAADPTHALVMVRPDRCDRETRVCGTAKMARIINRAIAYRCYRWIVHHPKQTPLNGLSIPKPGKRATVHGEYFGIHLSPVSSKHASRPPRGRARVPDR